jgi:hypothetical protein
MPRPLIALTAVLLLPVLALCQTSTFAGRWDFNMATPNGVRACWLGVTQKDGQLEVWYQPPGGNAYQVRNFKMDGSHLTLNMSPTTATRPGLIWELDASGGQLTGIERRGSTTIELTGVRAPDLKRIPPKSWSSPQPLFNGHNLDGWEPIGDPARSHWTIQDGLLVNQAKGANLRSTRTFDDFKVHFQVNCPEDGNSGFYLRGRYEVQIEYEPLAQNPPERRIGSIYGRIAPKPELPRTPGKWETFDVTLVGRTVTVARNGVTTIDQQQIEGITGGALDANEGESGPFYIQGDHTGGLQFRDITVSVPEH